MATERIHASLTPEEWKLISTLRELPPSPLQERVSFVIHELVEFARDPGCEEMQADGAPCAAITAGCEYCARVTEILNSFDTRLPEKKTAPAAESPA